MESESPNGTVTNKRLSKEDKEKILKEFEEFESQLAGAITSMVKNLHQEDDCAEGDKDTNGRCRKIPPGLQLDLGEAGKSLLQRLENVEHIISRFVTSNY